MTGTTATTPPTGLRGALVLSVLALLSIFPPLATDMYLSAMGDLARALNASAAATELSLSLFFLGLCLGQLLIGPLIDAFGRKGPLLAGVALYAATSAGLLLVADVVPFNALRFLQAIGACAGMVVGRAIVMDLWSGRQAAKALTVLVMLMTLGPILSPFLGSLLLTAFGWRSIFVAMVLVGVLALGLTVLAIPETLPRARRSPGAIRGALGHFGTLATRPRFLLPTLVAALIQAPMFAFITASSGVFQGGFGLSSQAYGLLFGLIASALVVAGRLNGSLLNRFDPRQIMWAGLPVFLIAALVLLTVSGTDRIWVLVPPLWIALGAVGLLSANAMTLAMEGSPEAAGLGSAGIGAVQFAIAFATSSLVALAGTATALPMAVAIFLCAVLATGLWTLMRRQGMALPVAD